MTMYDFDVPDSEARYNGSFADPVEVFDVPDVLRFKVHLTKRCPTCARENRLTIRDVQLGYHCSDCSDAMEGERR
jgi:hypothetical protein